MLLPNLCNTADKYFISPKQTVLLTKCFYFISLCKNQLCCQSLFSVCVRGPLTCTISIMFVAFLLISLCLVVVLSDPNSFIINLIIK